MSKPKQPKAEPGSVPLVGRDVFYRVRVAEKNETLVDRARTWDAEAFFRSLAARYAKEGGVVEAITEGEYLIEKHGEKRARRNFPRAFA